MPGVERWCIGFHNEGWLQAIASAAPRADVERSGAHLPADIVVRSLEQLEPNAFDMVLQETSQ